MTPEENTLWLKLASLNLDDDNASFKFSHRLARENGWTISYSKQVIEEYKKFIFLCTITNTGVTPSDQVDQAWHLHLTYTKSYWKDLCENILNKEIHHNPTKGGKSEGEKFNDFYTDTIKLYKEKFKKEPPISIWPNNKKRFSDINFQRINLKNYWLVKRPKIGVKNLILISIILIGIFSIQASSSDNTGLFIVLIVLVGIIVYNIFNNKNGGNNSGNGCSGGGCGSSGGHSGCSSSGCSGCGGCGGGD